MHHHGKKQTKLDTLAIPLNSNIHMSPKMKDIIPKTTKTNQKSKNKNVDSSKTPY